MLRLRMPDRATAPSTTWSAATITFAAEHVPDFVHRPRQRRPAVHAGQPGRRRADGDHPRAARRGPAVRRRRARSRCTRRCSDDRRRRRLMPQFGHLPYVMGEGNKKLSKRDPQSVAGPVPRARLPARGHAQLPGAAGLVDAATTGTIFTLGRDGRGVRRSPGQRQPGALRPEEGRGDQRGAPARCSTPTTSPRGWCRSCRAPGWSPRRADRRAARSCWPRRAPLVQERIDRARRGRRRCCGFLFVAGRDFAVDDDAAAKALGADAGRRRWRPRMRRWTALPDWTHRGDRGGAAGGARRRAGAQARRSRSPRCGSRSPAARSRRRCSSRWSCSAATCTLARLAGARLAASAADALWRGRAGRVACASGRVRSRSGGGRDPWGMG